MIKKQIIAFFLLAVSYWLLAPAQAHAIICGVCTAAAFAGVGLSRYLHIDDLISGLWVGGALASVTSLTIGWLNRKEIRFYGRKILVTAIYYGFVIVPFYRYDLVTHPRNKYIHETYIGIDKLILSIVVGSIFFVAAAKWYDYLKAENDGHAHFPFERVAIPIGTLLILSAIAYFITK